MKSTPNYVFKFLSYYLDRRSLVATFCYQGIDNFIFTEKITFAPNPSGKKFNPSEDPNLDALLDRALFLSFILIGTSYFKTHPTKNVHIDLPLDHFQAHFFNQVFQQGLSQYAFENQLTREQLAHFFATPNYLAPDPLPYQGKGILSLQSGGKDSLLTAALLTERHLDFTPWYVSSDPKLTHPAVIDSFFDHTDQPKAASIALRELDLEHLRRPGSLNGHVPVTFILQSLALIQVILNHQQAVLTSIGQEGNEPHAFIGDLPVNHQWSKTWEAEQLFIAYVKRYLSSNLIVGSPLRGMSELLIAEQFVKKCWQRYGYSFSSCNRANYKQQSDNHLLKWCGDCPKCANSYLLFCPFLPPQLLQSLFADQDLFQKESLIKTFKGLLGVDGVMKPFECIGSLDELRTAYHHRQSDYSALPFPVPTTHYNYRQPYPIQSEIVELFNRPAL